MGQFESEKKSIRKVRYEKMEPLLSYRVQAKSVNGFLKSFIHERSFRTPDWHSSSIAVQHFGFELDRARIVIINGIRVLDMDAILNEDDLIVVFPLGGG